MVIELAAFATSYGSGPFHPAIRQGRGLFYWPNRTFETEDEAQMTAQLALDDAYNAANALVVHWNLLQVDTSFVLRA